MGEIKVFGKPRCVYCEVVKEMFDGNGVEYVYKNVEEDPELKEFLESKGLSTVPQIFISDEYIGDSNSAVDVLERLGKA